MENSATIIKAARKEWAFQLAGSDKVWTLPLMGSLPVGLARKVAKMPEAMTEAQMLDAAFDLFDELCPGLTDVVTSDQLAEIMLGWREASQVSPGESQASSD